MEFEISLNNVRFYAYHGVLEAEKELGNEFEVSLSVKVPYSENIETDDIKHAVSYADLYKVVEEEMQIPRRLLEKVASRIAHRIKEEFPKASCGKVAITKVRPPVQNMLGTASVTLIF